MLGRVMLAGLPVPNDRVAELAELARAGGAHDLADRLEGALDDGVALLALTIDERAIVLDQLEDPPDPTAAPRPNESRFLDSLVAARGITANWSPWGVPRG